MSKLSIAICGCGPAGLTAALLLQRAGHDVCIFERFHAPRPVGSGLLLQPTGLGVLKLLGLLGGVVQLGTPVHRLLGLAMPSGKTALDVSYSALGPGFCALGIHRSALFDVLFEAAQRHDIKIVPNTTIERLDERHDGIVPYAAEQGALGGFELVVDALGAQSPFARDTQRHTLEYGAVWVNVPWPARGFDIHRLEQRYVAAREMLGVLPIGRPNTSAAPQAAVFWSLRRAAFDTWRERGIGGWRQDVARLWPEALGLLDHLDDLQSITYARYDHFTSSKPYSRRLVRIGDSAHATSPQLGQGANMALLDALALSVALESVDNVPEALARYHEARKRHIKLFQGASALFTPFYQSDSRLLPMLRDWIAAPLSRVPPGDKIVARLVSGMTVAPLRHQSFAPVALDAPEGTKPGLGARA